MSPIRRFPDLLDAITRGWAVVLSGNLARLAIGFMASIIVARSLGPESFGAFVVLAAVANIVGTAGDLGLTEAAVRRMAAARAAGDMAGVQACGQAFLLLRAGSATFVALIGVALSGLIAGPVLGQPGQANLLRLAVLGVAPTAWSGAVQAILQATGRFRQFALAGLINPASTVLLAVALAAAGKLDIVSALIVLGMGTSIVSFAISWPMLPAARCFSRPSRAALFGEGRRLLRSGRWVWVANTLAMLTAYADILLVNHWGAPAAVSAYALAANLASKANVLNNSPYTVLMPATSALADQLSIRRYAKRALLRSALVALTLLPVFPLAGPFIALFYGPAFAPAADILRILLIVVIFDLFPTPLLLLAFPYNRPGLLATAEGLRLGTLSLAAIWLIPVYGPVGAVIAKLGARIVGAAFTLAVLRRSKVPPLEAVTNHHASPGQSGNTL